MRIEGREARLSTRGKLEYLLGLLVLRTIEVPHYPTMEVSYVGLDSYNVDSYYMDLMIVT